MHLTGLAGRRAMRSASGEKLCLVPSICLLLSIGGLAFASSAWAGQIYRWLDEEGAVHYSDKIPPDQVDRGHTRITGTGVAVDSVPPVKSPEELQREQALERLRIQQQRLIEEQAAADSRLLRAYRSVDDLVMARNGQLAGIDAMVGVARAHIRRQQQWLMDLYAQAADLERAGKAVPGHLRTSIANAEESIRDAYARIIEREKQKQEVRESFERDLKRYRKLVGLPAERAGADSPIPQTPTKLKNLVTCSDPRACDTLWQRATAFVREHSTTPVHRAGENLLVTAAARTPEDISLILTRIQERDRVGAALFLDVQCLARRRDNKDCLDPRAEVLLDRFSQILRDASASAASLAAPKQGADALVGKQVEQ